jgi:tetratricopeptide (TPR) repeat protein
MFRKAYLGALIAGAILATVSIASAQKDANTIDVQDYRIDCEIVPASQLLRARTEVTFVPAGDTRSAMFEINGSLAIKRITLKSSAMSAPPAPAPEPATSSKSSSKSSKSTSAKEAKSSKEPSVQQVPELQFIQDSRESFNVRVDLGGVVPGGKPVTLVFEYEGALESAQGGPLQNARLAFVGEQGSYLFYASRWFPFHDYAVDRATYLINVTVPKGVTAVGYSEQSVIPVSTIDPKTKTEFMTYSFSSKTPLLPGNLAAAKYLSRIYTDYGFPTEVFFKAGSERWADHTAQIVGKHVEYYSSKFGKYPFGDRIRVAQTDDETLPTYSGAGIIFASDRSLTEGFDETVAREVGYQWWGQTVGVKSFDDAWLAQGLSEFSALLFIKDNANEMQFQQALQAQLERALAFEQSSSIRNAPQQLDDQSPAYRSVIFYKGSLVFNMLRQFLGQDQFDKMMNEYVAKYAGKNVSIDEFEQFASKSAGRPLRSFFGQWVDSTGVPEFRAEYRMLRNTEGFRVPGTVKQDLDTFEMPIDILLKTETGSERQSLVMHGTSADFDIQTKSKPIEVIVDPDSKVLHSSDELRQGVIVRRGIEHFREQEFIEAEQQFQAAIKLNRGLSWAWYNLGLLYMTQRNYNKSLDALDQALNGNLRPDWIEVWAYIYRGNAWDALGQRERAVAEYNRALSNGNNHDNAQAVAQAYIAQPFDPKRTKTESQSGT